MAGHYYYDPRPYYGINMSTNLMPLDELFYKYEPVPYWMDQRMAPLAYPADYHSGQCVKQVMTRGPEVQQLMLPFNARPELPARDDMYADTYNRAPQFTGFAPYPEMRQVLRGQSQDDTYLHTMTPQYVNSPQLGQFPHQGASSVPYTGYVAMNEMAVPIAMPMSYMGSSNGGQSFTRQGAHLVPMRNHTNNQTFPHQRFNGGDHQQMGLSVQGNKNSSVNNNGSSNQSYNNGDGNGYGTNKSSTYNGDGYGTNKSSRKTLYNNDDDDDDGYSNKSKQEMYNDDYGYGNKTSKKTYSNNDSHSTKSKHGITKVQQQQQQYTNGDSSSESDEDEYVGTGKKWGAKPLLKYSKGDTYSQGKGYEAGSKKSNNMSIVASGKKQSGRSKSKSARYQNGWESSSDENESFAYTKKASKAVGQRDPGITQVQHSHDGFSGKEQSLGLNSHVQSYGQQSQSKPFSSQVKSVELQVPICCDNCERKVTACLEYVAGVESVLCDQWQKKVIVYGNVKPDVVLKRVRRVKKASQMWPQVPKRVPVH